MVQLDEVARAKQPPCCGKRCPTSISKRASLERRPKPCSISRIRRYKVDARSRPVHSMRRVRASVRQRGALRSTQKTWRPVVADSHEVRELPALRASCAPPGALAITQWPQVGNGSEATCGPSAPWTTSPSRRRPAAVLLSSMGNPQQLPDLLGASAAEREPGDEPLHRPSARAHGDPRVAGQPSRARCA